MSESYEDASDYDSRRPRRKLTAAEQELSARQAEEKQYVVSRRLQALKEVQRSRARPVESRFKQIGARGFQEAKKSYGQTAKTLTHRGPGVIRNIAKSFTGISSEKGTVHTGLSSVVEEISRGYVEPFSRSYFKEPNQADRDFFGNQNQPVERDFFGHGNGSNIDMNNLLNNQNKKKEDTI